MKFFGGKVYVLFLILIGWFLKEGDYYVIWLVRLYSFGGK